MKHAIHHAAGAERGFTLVELLVVVAIIALLLSILLPALNKARAVTRDVVCKANMRQLAVAGLSYGNDYRGVLPHNALAHNPGDWRDWGLGWEDQQIHWPEQMSAFLKQPIQWWGGGSQFYAHTRRTMLSCPQARLDFSAKVDPEHGMHYNLNVHLGGRDAHAGPGPFQRALRGQTFWFVEASAPVGRPQGKRLVENRSDMFGGFDMPFAWMQAEPGWNPPPWDSFFDNASFGAGHPGASANFLMGDSSVRAISHGEFVSDIVDTQAAKVLSDPKE